VFRQDLNLEERLLVLARTRGHTARAERTVAGFSRLGEHGALWLAIGFAGGALQPSLRGEWRRARRAVLVTYAVNTAIKFVVRRRRPNLPGLGALTGTTTGLSFPSAHAATSFAAALLYSRRGLPAAPLYGTAAAMACSRVYLGVHYPSDILAGAALGSALGAALGGPADRVEGLDGMGDR
jgi:membrane-associated phospholipid phosphatase